MKWFYNKDGKGVLAVAQPEGYHYDFRGNSLIDETEPEATEEELETAIELEDLKTQYMEKFGKKANGRANKKSLIKALEDDS